MHSFFSAAEALFLLEDLHDKPYKDPDKSYDSVCDGCDDNLVTDGLEYLVEGLMMVWEYQIADSKFYLGLQEIRSKILPLWVQRINLSRPEG